MRDLTTKEREEIAVEKIQVLVHMCRAFKRDEIKIKDIHEHALSILEDERDLINALDDIDFSINKIKPKQIQIPSFVNRKA